MRGRVWTPRSSAAPRFWTAKVEGVPPGRRELPPSSGHRAKSGGAVWLGPFILLSVGEEWGGVRRGGTQGEREWRESPRSSGMRGPRTPRGRAPRCCLPILPRPSRRRRAARQFPDGAAERAGRGGAGLVVGGAPPRSGRCSDSAANPGSSAALSGPWPTWCGVHGHPRPPAPHAPGGEGSEPRRAS